MLILFIASMLLAYQVVYVLGRFETHYRPGAKLSILIPLAFGLIGASYSGVALFRRDTISAMRTIGAATLLVLFAFFRTLAAG